MASELCENLWGLLSLGRARVDRNVEVKTSVMTYLINPRVTTFGLFGYIRSSLFSMSLPLK